MAPKMDMIKRLNASILINYVLPAGVKVDKQIRLFEYKVGGAICWAILHGNINNEIKRSFEGNCCIGRLLLYGRITVEK